jgi:hypothetical protein
MDNVNVIRVGFLTPCVKVVDCDMEMGDPIDRSGANYTCLIFVNPDEDGASVLKDIENGLPVSSGNFDWTLSAILPCKTNPGKNYRDKYGFSTRIYCDSDLRFGTLFGIVDSSSARPAYHPTVFIIGDEGSVRYRQAIGGANFDGIAFRTAISGLI